MWLRFVLVRPIGVLLAKKEKYNLSYTGEEHAPYRGPFIVVANHQTAVDVFATGLAIHKTLNRSRMIPWAKTEIKKGKEGFLGWLLWHYLGTIPIDRDAQGQAPKAIKKSLEHLRKGKIVFVHPEGTRQKAGQLGAFMYGVANLARAVPAPILPAGVYRREEDGGIQVNIGVPFFMPDLEPAGDDQEEGPESKLRQQVDLLKKWSEQFDRDKKGMKLIANMVDIVVHTVAKLSEAGHRKYCMMATSADNEYLRERVLELLPEGWRKVEELENLPG